MEKKCVLFLGDPGAGKSTSINKLLNQEKAKVGHSLLEDGTEKIERYPLPDHHAVELIDTPGILSKNFNTNVTERIQSLFPDMKFLVVLVIDARRTRLNQTIDVFRKCLHDLLQTDTFCVLWSFSADIQVRGATEFREKFPKSLQFYDNNISDLRSFLVSPEAQFKELVVKVKKEKAVAAPLNGINRRSAGPTPRPALVPAPAHRFGFSKCMNSLLAFKKAGSTAPTSQNIMINKLLEIKKHEGIKIQNMKKLGDAYLKALVYNILLAKGCTELENDGQPYLSNDGPMLMFYNAYIAEKHDKEFPSEVTSSSHAKTDVVESLFEYCRVNDPPVARFIIIKLFEYQNNRLS